MPYIKREARPEKDQALDTIDMSKWAAGDLNYFITRAVWKWIQAHGIKYENINAAIGAFECAKLEMYRRLAAPYEDKKIAENGDVY